MTLFADTPSDYGMRKFRCGWPDRRESAADIAARAQRFARRLEAIDPAFGRFGHDRRSESEDILPDLEDLLSDYNGPITSMALNELAEEIDHYDRFDPPPRPAPVGPAGYSSTFGDEAVTYDPSKFAFTLNAGVYGGGRPENCIEAWPHPTHPLWRDIERGVQFLEATVECWDAKWGCAFQSIFDGGRNMRIRPWLAWTAEPLQSRLEPFRPYPYPFPLDDADPPAEVRPWRGGQLSIWP